MPATPTQKQSPPSGAARAGRPRHAGVSATVMQATRELLASEGYAGTRIDDVARRAGVAKTTIYRRWPSKAALVIAAVQESFGELPVSAETSRGDLREGIRWVASRVADPAIAAGLSGLYADAAHDSVVRELFLDHMRRPYIAQISAAYGTTPEVAALILDIVTGATTHHVAGVGDSPSAATTDLFVELIMSGLGSLPTSSPDADESSCS